MLQSTLTFSLKQNTVNKLSLKKGKVQLIEMSMEG